MQEHRIAIGQVIEHGDGLIELIANGGINISAEMVEELFEFFRQITPAPQLVLANRKNSYSMSFQAQKLLASYPHARAVAVLTHSRLGMMFARFIPKTRYNLKVFMDRDAALFWLRSFSVGTR